MRPTVTRLVLGGLIGTLAMTAMMYMVAPMMGVRMDIAAMLGSMLGGSWTAGLAMHLVNGTLVFPLVYGYLLVSRLPGPPLLRGVVLWLIAQTMVMPMMGAGLFSAAAGGTVAAIASLVGHLVYGAILGTASAGADAQLAHA